jgi:hypothetical protein
VALAATVAVLLVFSPVWQLLGTIAAVLLYCKAREQQHAASTAVWM